MEYKPFLWNTLFWGFQNTIATMEYTAPRSPCIDDDDGGGGGGDGGSGGGGGGGGGDEDLGTRGEGGTRRDRVQQHQPTTKCTRGRASRSVTAWMASWGGVQSLS